jgi:hypothetical protein
VWASEAIDLIKDLVPASDLVSLLADEAEEALMQAARHIYQSRPRYTRDPDPRS